MTATTLLVTRLHVDLGRLASTAVRAADGRVFHQPHDGLLAEA
ncbi:hypothetical protein ABT009_28750 [Streptomyces sp. NPDC002896]